VASEECVLVMYRIRSSYLERICCFETSGKMIRIQFIKSRNWGEMVYDSKFVSLQFMSSQEIGAHKEVID
jgi:hypothetical protein